MASANSDHWSDYWAQGRFTSLPQDFAANYDGEVADYWLEAFRAVPAGGRVIDLCTGNGAVALLARGFSRDEGRDLEVVAVDAATINTQALEASYPDQSRLLREIRFISNCRIEELELGAEEFDLVTSQFGLEYCDWQSAAVQVTRLLRPGGRLVMVNHSASSDILKYMERENGEYGLLDQLKILESMQAYLDGVLHDAGLRRVLKAAHSRLVTAYQQDGSPLFHSVLTALGGILALDEAGLASRRAELAEYCGQVRHGADRLADMLRVNQAIRSDPEWYRVFEKAGLELEETGTIRYRGEHDAGKFVMFVKPGS